MFICWIFSRPHVSEENLISDGPQEHLCYRTRLKWIVIERIFRAYHSLGARIWARPDQILVPLRTTYNTTNTSIGDCPCLARPIVGDKSPATRCYTGTEE